MFNFGSVSNFDFGDLNLVQNIPKAPSIPENNYFSPGSTINHGNGWTTTTTPVFPGVSGGGHSVTHYTGIFNTPTMPPNYNWNPPIINPVANINIPNNIGNDGYLSTINKDLKTIKEELNKTNSSISYDFSKEKIYAYILFKMISSLIDKNTDNVSLTQELKNGVFYYKNLLEQRSNLLEFIKKQESVRYEKLHEIAREYKIENFLKFIDTEDANAFMLAAQMSAPYIPSRKLPDLWSKCVVVPAMELFNANHELINVLNKIISAKKYVQVIIEKSINVDNEMSGIDMYFHYTDESGKALTLSEIGVHNKVRNLMHKSGAFNKPEGSIQSRFISQIQQGERIDFENNYDFAVESKTPFFDPLWAIGGATVRGKLADVKAENVGDKYRVSGVIVYELYDNFTDPYDIKNVTGKEWNPNGTPYDITGKWSESVNFDVNKDIYENKIKLMLGQ
ncbi:hypothetical protein L7750_14895 [Xenorhabdus bovienii]|uniref:hypothetical protein n=1 Tax=Xenorhabdus bovienii TaxID=40576 RepID=UPI001EE13433|nr:hypothetical protein [Xenorhabdus bovienii]MCG3471636.1 hypothetical protein [Xenorhabdus bovienii]